MFMHAGRSQIIIVLVVLATFVAGTVAAVVGGLGAALVAVLVMGALVAMIALDVRARLIQGDRVRSQPASSPIASHAQGKGREDSQAPGVDVDMIEDLLEGLTARLVTKAYLDDSLDAFNTRVPQDLLDKLTAHLATKEYLDQMIGDIAASALTVPYVDDVLAGARDSILVAISDILAREASPSRGAEKETPRRSGDGG